MDKIFGTRRVPRIRLSRQDREHPALLTVGDGVQ
jgi:hypothetical protein